jgi:hypothetical protein
MVTDNNGVWVAIDAAFYRNFNTHYPLHPKAVDSNRCSIGAVRERDDNLRLKPRQGDHFEWRDQHKASQPKH